MPRRKKLDLAPVMEALISEIEFRINRTVKDAFHDVERRIDRLEKQLAGRGGRTAATQDFKQCRKPGCTGRVIAHRLCSRHYQQWRYHRKKATTQVPPRKRPAKGSA